MGTLPLWIVDFILLKWMVTTHLPESLSNRHSLDWSWVRIVHIEAGWRHNLQKEVDTY